MIAASFYFQIPRLQFSNYSKVSPYSTLPFTVHDCRKLVVFSTMSFMPQIEVMTVTSELLFNSNNNISYYFPSGSDGKESACNAGDLGLISGWGIFPGGGNGNQLQYSCLENFMARGAWQATVHGVEKSNTFTFNNNKECGVHCYYFC